MNIIKKSLLSLLCLAAVCFTACDDQWDNADVSGDKSQTLWEAIASRSELSEFKKVLEATGVDSMMNASGVYTVLAPTNDAMASLSDAEKQDVSLSHIARLEFNKAQLSQMNYLSMLNGKQVVLDQLDLTEEEIVCRNGILRFAHRAIGERLNIYEQLKELAPTNDMAAYIVGLSDSIKDEEASFQTGVDENGEPIYQIQKKFYNPLFQYIPLNNNDSLLTLVLLDNETFSTLQAKYWKYMKQHSGENRQWDYVKTFKVDSAKTDSVVRAELVRDLTCYFEGAKEGASEFVSTLGVKLTMNEGVDSIIETANGFIKLAKNVDIRIKDNKIKDFYVQGEDYYKTNEQYVYVRTNIHAMGGKDVVVCGVDTLCTYQYLDWANVDSLGNVPVATKTSGDKFGYNNKNGFGGNTYPQVTSAIGASYLAYKAPLFSCKYKIYWRSVNDRPLQCAPDTACVDYAKYVENPNYPCGGVVRNIQKFYISQPGDLPLEFNNLYQEDDCIINNARYNIFSGTYKNYGCMSGADPEATDDELGKKSNFSRLGINAGYKTDDMTFESPLYWCQTAVHTTIKTPIVYFGGIVDVAKSTIAEKWNEKTGKPITFPRDIFCCFYAGEATIFVTNSPFNINNTTKGSASNPQPNGSIYLDYIHFVPEIDE